MPLTRSCHSRSGGCIVASIYVIIVKDKYITVKHVFNFRNVIVKDIKMSMTMNNRCNHDR